MINWTKSDAEVFSKAIKSLFIAKGTSMKSLINKSSESNVDFFIKRITPQIMYVLEHDLQYETPEEWDYSFTKIPWEHQRKRKSDAILKRFASWEDFLMVVENMKLNKETCYAES